VSLVDPLPAWPLELFPQHFAVPSESCAQEWSIITLMVTGLMHCPAEHATMHLLPHAPQLSVSVMVSTHPASQTARPPEPQPPEPPEPPPEELPEPLPEPDPPELPLPPELLELATPEPLPELDAPLPPLDELATDASGSTTGVLGAPDGGFAVSKPFVASAGSAQ
jgi:hypothetical protein